MWRPTGFPSLCFPSPPLSSSQHSIKTSNSHCKAAAAMASTTSMLLLSSPPIITAATNSTANISSASPCRYTNAVFHLRPRHGRIVASQLVATTTNRASRRASRFVCEVAVELGGSRSSEGEEGESNNAKPKAEAGSRVRIKGPLKVFHVMKAPELEVGGMEGEVKEVVTTFKGKPISATLPYKVQLSIDGEGDKKIKFFVHLKEDEFEVLQ